ncbi:cyclin-like protein [Delitschia confertaspora ATCC 74209]|uniref:RNA polymerase II holoenzyme cyclin-like subunit n=1 Tax=Delitschia confertaspora ATCC 74209 TaxID=1513339 RepID=A0A9P4JNS3_9PLEO|nr:cyclin-like protein [Delitschia confertaspora ATCC 74209]
MPPHVATPTPKQLAVRERPRPPPPAVTAAEEQWVFTEEELLQAPSIVDGMSPEEEKNVRKKGFNFLYQVAVMLKLPQTTISTAAVFFNRFLMRQTLVAKNGFKPLHHYQIAATCLFLASKVEETTRKMKEFVVACVRVALKDPNRLVDEQTKDFWKWRDTILYNEDVILEVICFDLTVDSPYKIMYEMLKYYGVEHDKRLRNASWAFLNDSSMTQLCLLFSSRTIAAASLYCGARMAEVEFPDEDGKPWWEIQLVKIRDIRRACNIMVDIYEHVPPKDGERSIYVGLRTPEDADPLDAQTRLRSEQTPGSPNAVAGGIESAMSEQSLKRGRDGSEEHANGVSETNNGTDNSQDQDPGRDSKRPKREQNGAAEAAISLSVDASQEPAKPLQAKDATTPPENGTAHEDNVSEEGEVSE